MRHVTLSHAKNTPKDLCPFPNKRCIGWAPHANPSFGMTPTKHVSARFSMVRLMYLSNWIIKSVIDRDGATCQNNNHFERSTILNAP